MSSLRSSLLDPAFVADPFARLAELRERDPVHWDEALGTWFITRYEDVWSSLSDPRLSSDRRLARDYQPPPPDTWLAHFERRSMINADAEGHRRWRSRVSAGFTPRAVRRMDAQVREVVEQFAYPIRASLDASSEPVDLLARFTSPVPNTVIGRITGIPPYPGDEERFRSLAQAPDRQRSDGRKASSRQAPKKCPRFAGSGFPVSSFGYTEVRKAAPGSTAESNSTMRPIPYPL